MINRHRYKRAPKQCKQAVTWKSARNREEAGSKDKRGLYLPLGSPQKPAAEFSECAELLRKGKVKAQRRAHY